MFCEKCGKEIPDDSVFCDGCGERVQEETPDVTSIATEEVKVEAPRIEAPKVEAPKTETVRKPSMELGKYKNAIVGALVAVVIIVLGVGTFFWFNGNSGKNYLYTVLLKSKLSYQKEITQMVETNAVLKKTNGLLSKSYTQTLKSSMFKAKLSDNKKDKMIDTELAISGIPINFKMFLTDDQLIVGSPTLLYLKADPSKLGRDISQFADNNGVFQIGDAIEDSLSSFDFSYSKLTTGSVLKLSDNHKLLIDRYQKVLKALVDKSSYEKTKSMVEISGKDVKSTRLTLKVDRDILLDWLKNDVRPTIKNDKELERLFEDIMSFSGLYSTISYGGFGQYDYGEFEDAILDVINELEKEEPEFTLKVDLDVVKNVIVKARVELIGEDDEWSGDFAATGDKYRLNDIILHFGMDDSDVVEFAAKGEYIGADIVTSAMTLVDQYENKYSLDVEWDTKSASNNIQIKQKAYGNTNKYKATFAVDGEAVRAKVGEGNWSTNWDLNQFDSTATLPEDAMAIKDITVKEILAGLGEAADLVMRFLPF